MLTGQVNIGLLVKPAVFIALLGAAVQLFVPQQRPAGTLLGFERGFFGLQAVNELGHFGGVVGAAEDGQEYLPLQPF